MLKKSCCALAALCLLAPLTGAADNLDTLKAALKGIIPPTRTTPAAAAVAPIDYRQLPDIVGIHLGMPADEALKNFRKQYEKVQMAPLVRWAGAPEPSLMEFDVGLNVLGFVPEVVVVELTPPPQQSVVWKVSRRQGDPNHRMLHADVLAGLRKKYGPESIAFRSENTSNNGLEPKPASDEQIGSLWWLFDEQGRRLPLPPSGVQGINACRPNYAGDDGRAQVIFRDEPAYEPLPAVGLESGGVNSGVSARHPALRARRLANHTRHDGGCRENAPRPHPQTGSTARPGRSADGLQPGVAGE